MSGATHFSMSANGFITVAENADEDVKEAVETLNNYVQEYMHPTIPPVYLHIYPDGTPLDSDELETK